jgi:eukaryotic-like serine/threonine-protein kinase
MWSDLTRSGVTSTEEGRAFYQARLSIFGLCLFALAGGSWLIMSLGRVFGVTEGVPTNYNPLSASGLLHLTNGLLGGVMWLATRHGVRSAATLHALDIGIMLGLVAVWGSVGASLAPPSGAFIAVLSFTMGTLARAIVVPSTAQRTLFIGVIGATMIVSIIVLRTGGAIAMACWCGSAVTLGTLASHTIFGLRREAREARVLGQYTLETKIGEGGMGAVWRARHALLRRPTAIKLLPTARMGEAAVARFEREVQFTARLTHPNSVAIYDYGRTRDGIFYYAMELLDGMDLERLVNAHGAQPPGRVVHVLTQICSALAEAHDLGLVHRDVKPANVLLSPRLNEHEFAKIVDFGLVKSVELGGQLTAISSSQVITGTPLFMSPEAILTPDAVDGRSDLYSLGALAWYMLVGRPPFEGDSVLEVCSQHLQAEPHRPSQALGRTLPADLEDIVLACMAKQAVNRPPDARTLRGALEGCSAANQWSAEQASEFWSGHQPEPADDASRARTLPLDVDGRIKAQGL